MIFLSGTGVQFEKSLHSSPGGWDNFLSEWFFACNFAMMKQVANKLTSVLIISLAAMLAAFSPSALMAYDFVADDIAFNIENGKAVVTYKGNYSPQTYMQTELIIPDLVTYQGQDYPVTAIGNYAFNSCYMLERISLPATIEEIRTGAFQGCNSLETLVIPESVASIGDYALQCRGLRSLTLSCRMIGKDALKGLLSLETIISPDASDDGKCLIIDGVLRLFASVGITQYTLPESVLSIDSYVFSDNSELEEIALPSGLIAIRYRAFDNCSSLKSVNIPSSVKEIESSFTCKALEKVYIEDVDNYCRITGYKDSYAPIFNINNIEFLDYDGNRIRDIVFPGDTKTLRHYLFANSSIRSIIIEEGVEEIEYDALRNCRHLTYVSVPSTVTKIGNASFRGCTRLTDFVYGAADATAGYHVKEDREDEHSYIFTDCPSLTHVELRSSVKVVPAYLFADSNIKSVSFPATVQSIGSNLFSLGNLEEARIEGAPEMGAVFSGCTRLSKVTVTSSLPPAASYLGAVGGASLFVPEDAVGLYSEAPGWSNFKAVLSEPQAGQQGHIFEYEGLRFEITDIEMGLCKVTSPQAGMDYGAKIVIPHIAVAENGETYSVTEIDPAAFTFTSKVASIEIPNSISSIAGIDNTTAGLKEINVADDNPSYHSIDGVLFDKDAINLLLYPAAKEGPYTVPQTVKNVGARLAAKINLEELTISNSVEGRLVMSNSPSLKYLKMGDGITSFSVSNCPTLEYLEIGPGVEYIKGEDFGAGYHDLWNTCNIRTLIFADSPDPVLIYTMSVDDGYLSAIPTSKCSYIYIGRDLKAAGSPLMQHFSSPVEYIAFGPDVTRLDAQLLRCMQYGTKKISVPAADFWASTPRLYSSYMTSYSLYIDGLDISDLTVTAPEIVERAFCGVNNIRSITLSENVGSIGSRALDAYPHLDCIILENPSPGYITLEGDPVSPLDYDKVTLCVPDGTKHLYENAEYWKNFTNIITGSEMTDAPAVPDVQAPASVQAIYDLQGRRVAPANMRCGIYISRDSNGNVAKILR